MPKYQFYQLDVFTNQAFGGNPLAVFPEGAGLSTKQMQTIALEMNLSETTLCFLLKDPRPISKSEFLHPRVNSPSQVIRSWERIGF